MSNHSEHLRVDPVFAKRLKELQGDINDELGLSLGMPDVTKLVRIIEDGAPPVSMKIRRGPGRMGSFLDLDF